MKNRITHVAVMSLVLTAVVPGEVVAQQQRSYDRFKDRTSYEAKVELSELSKTSRGISLSLHSVVDGDRAVTKSDSFTVSAIVTFNMSYDVRCAGTSFDMLVDGRAVSLPSDMPAFNRYEYAILSFGKKMTLAEAGPSPVPTGSRSGSAIPNTAWTMSNALHCVICSRTLRWVVQRVADVGNPSASNHGGENMQTSDPATNLYQCPACRAAIPSGRSSAKCPKCYADLPKAIIESNRASANAREERGSTAACVALGLVALAIGLYFLINPSAGGYGNIANMHALAVGQALTIAGAVLLGLGIRPR